MTRIALGVRDRGGRQGTGTAAEAKLYRDALATAATGLGLPVTRYPVRGLRGAAASALGVSPGRLADTLAGIGTRVGRPWRKEHAEAAMAALAALDG